MITVSPEKKIGEYSMSIIDAIFFFLYQTRKKSRVASILALLENMVGKER